MDETRDALLEQHRPAAEPAIPPARRGLRKAEFKTREVVDLLGLTRRQLQYWAKTGLIEPSERTPGGHHRYSFDDLVALKATKRLIDAGVSVQKIRKSVHALQRLLPQVEYPLSELVLVTTGDVVLVFRDDTVFEAVTGQEWVFEVATFEREVAAYRGQSVGAESVADPDGHRQTSPGRRRGLDADAAAAAGHAADAAHVESDRLRPGADSARIVARQTNVRPYPPPTLV